MNYFFNPSARVEHLEHVAYYETQRNGLGARYLSAVDLAMARVCEAPQHFRIEFAPEIRRCRIAGFPYNILFREVGNEIEILVVAPHRRRPDYWLGRI